MCKFLVDMGILNDPKLQKSSYLWVIGSDYADFYKKATFQLIGEKVIEKLLL